jgi:hypothetical protein
MDKFLYPCHHSTYLKYLKPVKFRESDKVVYKDVKSGLGVVIHTCVPSYSGGIGGRIAQVRGQPSVRCYLKNKLTAKGLGTWLN